MEVLPQRSSGVLLAPFRDGALAYDQVTETRHRLNATAGTLLSRCDGETAVAEIVDSWATATGASASEVTAGVRQAVDEFARLGLVGRHEPWEVPSRLPGSTTPALDGATTGRVHPALDRTVVFRSTDRDLIAAIDDYLGAGELEIHGPTSEPLVIDVEYRPDGQIRARFGDEFVFSRLETCLLQITTAVDRLTDAPTDFPVLHAGAVRAPTGEIVLVTAESGGGKSTLVAAFVAAGWGYLGDETIGVRSDGTAVGYPKRIGLSDVSRTVLGLGESIYLDDPITEVRADVFRLAGDVGPVSRVVVVEYRSGVPLEVVDVNPETGIGDLISNTTSFGADGDAGLASLCDLAASVPIHHVRTPTRPTPWR